MLLRGVLGDWGSCDAIFDPDWNVGYDGGGAWCSNGICYEGP